MRAQSAGPHPDADVLTAFAEQSLAGRERDQVVQHLARCGDCRDVIALALPASEEVQVTDAGWLNRPARSGWLTWPAFRWGFVAAGILAVASIGVLQLRHGRQTMVATSLPSAEAPSPQLAAEAPKPAAPQLVVPQSGVPAAIPRTGQERESLPKQAQKKDQASPNAVPAPKTAGTNNAMRARPGLVQRSSPTSTSGAANRGAGPQVGAGNGFTTTARNSFLLGGPRSADSAVVARAKPASAQAPPVMPSPSLRTDPGLLKTQLRWTISDAGALQRSVDGGQTWQDVTSAAANDATNSTLKIIFRALSVSTNASEVWAGGSDATLYHTTDAGNGWLRVFPSDGNTTLTGDIVSIQFNDAANGTIRTSTAESWTTSDDGQSWHKQ